MSYTTKVTRAELVCPVTGKPPPPLQDPFSPESQPGGTPTCPVCGFPLVEHREEEGDAG